MVVGEIIYDISSIFLKFQMTGRFQFILQGEQRWTDTSLDLFTNTR